MINTLDLKIGNKVLYNGEVHTVCSLTRDVIGFINGAYKEVPTANVDPLILSAEQMVDTVMHSATLETEDGLDKGWRFRGLFLTNIGGVDVFKLCVIKDGIECMHFIIKYVHELQNFIRDFYKTDLYL